MLSDKPVVPRKGLEPSRPCGHCDLNAARLPIPPSGHGVGALDTVISSARQRGNSLQPAVLVGHHLQ